MEDESKYASNTEETAALLFKSFFNDEVGRWNKCLIVILDLLSHESFRQLLALRTTGKSDGKSIPLWQRIDHYLRYIPTQAKNLILFFFHEYDRANINLTLFNRYFNQSSLIVKFIQIIKEKNVMKEAVLDRLMASRLVKKGPGIHYFTPYNLAKSLAYGVSTLFLACFTGVITNVVTNFSATIAAFFLNHVFYASLISGASALLLPFLTYVVYLLVYTLVFECRSMSEKRQRDACLSDLKTIPHFRALHEFKPTQVKLDLVKIENDVSLDDIVVNTELFNAVM